MKFFFGQKDRGNLVLSFSLSFQDIAACILDSLPNLTNLQKQLKTKFPSSEELESFLRRQISLKGDLKNQDFCFKNLTQEQLDANPNCIKKILTYVEKLYVGRISWKTAEETKKKLENEKINLSSI